MFDNFLAVFLPGFNLIDFQLQAETLLITTRPAALSSACPRCNIPSRRVHSYYTRRPKDLPLAGLAVGLFLQVRRFRCLNPACQTATFAEGLPQLIAPTAQRTRRLNLSLHSLALALGGKPERVMPPNPPLGLVPIVCYSYSSKLSCLNGLPREFWL